MSEDVALSKSANLINSTLVPVESLLFYYGNISRETAEWILWDRGCQDGMYLVRESSGDYVLSLCFHKSILHYRIKRLPGGDVGLCGVPHQLFPGPVELVEGVEGLACKPSIPCNKSLDSILPLTHWGLTQDEIRGAILRKGQEWGLNETELMLSMSEEHNDVKNLIIKTLHEIQPWFHGHLSREQAENCLIESGLKDGKFLVRERNDSSYAFCLSHGGKIKHYKIDILPSGEFAIQDGQRFPSIIALVSHYSLFSDGLWCALTEPCDNRNASSSVIHVTLNKHQTLPTSPNPESLDFQTSSSSSSSSLHSCSSSVVANEIRAKTFDAQSSPSSAPLLNSPFSTGNKSKCNTGGVTGSAQKGIFTKLIQTVSGFENQNSSSCTSPAKSSHAHIVSLEDEPVIIDQKVTVNVTLTPQKRKSLCNSQSPVFKDEIHTHRRNSGPGNFKVLHKASSFDLIPAFISALFSGNDAKESCKTKKRFEGEIDGKHASISNYSGTLPCQHNHSKSEFYVTYDSKEVSVPVQQSSQEFETNQQDSNLKLCNKNSPKIKHYANKEILNGNGRSLSLGETDSCTFDTSKTKESDSQIFIRSASSPSVVCHGSKTRSTQPDLILKPTSNIEEPAKMSISNEKSFLIEKSTQLHSTTLVQKHSSIDLSDEISQSDLNSSSRNSSQDVISGENLKTTKNQFLGSELDLMYFDFDEDDSLSAINKFNSLPVPVEGNDFLSDPLSTEKSSNMEIHSKVSSSESSDQLDVYATLSGDSNSIKGTFKRNKSPILVELEPTTGSIKDSLCGSFLSQEDSELAYQTLRRHRRGPVTLDRSAITLNEKIGSGNFGEVWCGSFSSGSLEVLFAVKMLKESAAHQKDEILSEAHTMAALDHPHIVRLIGVCDSDPFMLVMELAPLGPLNKYLKAHRDIPLDNILMLMVQVSNAMEFLESQQFVHRDLAARNVLLVNENFAKISDFGMSRALNLGKEYYRAETPGKWPLKWYAPECIYYFKFSTKSDVWSFGVTLWEAMSWGHKPYQGLNGGDILRMFDRNERLQKPNLCPDSVYDIMLQCWNFRPEDRPDFSILHELLKQCAASYKCR